MRPKRITDWAPATSVTIPGTFLPQRVMATIFPTFTFLRWQLRTQFVDKKWRESVSLVTLRATMWGL